jgi:hypothetical protein
LVAVGCAHVQAAYVAVLACWAKGYGGCAEGGCGCEGGGQGEEICEERHCCGDSDVLSVDVFVVKDVRV